MYMGNAHLSQVSLWKHLEHIIYDSIILNVYISGMRLELLFFAVR